MKGKGVAVLLAACAFGAVVVAAVACLPDLPSDQAAPPPPGCGDGYIDLDAGEQCDPGTPDAASSGCSSSCTMQCQSLIWPRNNHCYQLVEPGVSSFDPGSGGGATGLCIASGAHVATFASEDEFNEVASYFHLKDAGLPGWGFWVGLNPALTPGSYNATAPYEPGWSPACPGCYAHTLDPAQPLPRFDASLPDGAPIREGCVLGSSDPRLPTWEQFPCAVASRVQVLCEREPVGAQFKACEAGAWCVDLVWTHGSKSYVYQPSPATAAAAESACVALGGHLAVLRSHDEREQMWLQLSRLQSPPTAIWIGLSQRGDSGNGGVAGSWVWDDNTADGVPGGYPSPWAVNQPRPAGSPRAFLFHLLQQTDDTLAFNSGMATGVAIPYVCEVPAP